MIRNILNKIDTKLEFSDKDSEGKMCVKVITAGFLEGGLDGLFIIGIVLMGLHIFGQ